MRCGKKMATKPGAKFKQETITKVLQRNFKDEKTKINGDAAKMTAELVRIFVEEGAVRALKMAQVDGSVRVTNEHFEKILPQLLLDF